ncbi:hypothetical protein SCB49_00922 [unidentified eubacterium SCB49]|nr:hypothetical protein SCB49_00922 [unidentified eubacterium SCB49]
MFEKLKLKSLRKRVDKNLDARDMSQLHSRLKTIAFVINEEDSVSIETLHEIASSLGVEDGNYQVLVFQKYKKNEVLEEHQIHHKQIKWRGVVHNEFAQKFLERPFDVLIGYYNGTHPYLDFLISESAARFKVGLEQSDLRLFDLQIEVEISQNKLFVTELKKYLHVLGKVN